VRGTFQFQVAISNFERKTSKNRVNAEVCPLTAPRKSASWHGVPSWTKPQNPYHPLQKIWWLASTTLVSTLFKVSIHFLRNSCWNKGCLNWKGGNGRSGSRAWRRVAPRGSRRTALSPRRPGPPVGRLCAWGAIIVFALRPSKSPLGRAKTRAWPPARALVGTHPPPPPRLPSVTPCAPRLSHAAP
jgi:hypothetical protein